MFAERWLYDLLIYVYALSLVFAFSDLFYSNKRAQRVSTFFLFLVWLLQGAVFALRAFELFPTVTRFDSLFIYAWVLVTFTLILNRLHRMTVFVFAANFIGFTVLASNLFFVSDHSPVNEQLLLSELVFVHVTMAILSYAAFSLSSICAGLYLVGNYLLKKKKWNQFLRRLPSLDRLQFFSKWFVMTGTLLLVIAMILGAIYAYQTVGHTFWMDPKIWGSLLVLIVYGFVLVGWVNSGWQGRRLAWWNTLAFVVIIINYLISDSRLSFHHWI